MSYGNGMIPEIRVTRRMLCIGWASAVQGVCIGWAVRGPENAGRYPAGPGCDESGVLACNLGPQALSTQAEDADTPIHATGDGAKIGGYIDRAGHRLGAVGEGLHGDKMGHSDDKGLAHLQRLHQSRPQYHQKRRSSPKVIVVALRLAEEPSLPRPSLAPVEISL